MLTNHASLRPVSRNRLKAVTKNARSVAANATAKATGAPVSASSAITHRPYCGLYVLLAKKNQATQPSSASRTS